jgi:uncharacterized protein YciI
MLAESLEAAYAPFVASLLAGGFSPPADDGWNAEQIAAHITLNNDLIAEAAEKVAAGSEVSYDNEAGVDDAELTAYAAAVGGLAGLARDIERSAARLAKAKDSLGDRADTLIPVVIHDGGQIVVDRQTPIGAFCEGNATFHLDLHLRQLKALEPEWQAGPPAAFDQYQLVLLERAPDAPALDDDAAQAIQRQHLGHFAKLRAAGFLLVSGPIRDPAIAGISIYRAGTPERARKLAEDDPAVRAGLYVIRAMDWYTAKDAIGWPDLDQPG